MTTAYSVPAISCDHCKQAIEHEVRAVAGVDTVEVDVAAKTVRVGGAADDPAVRSAIERAGYEITAATSG